jgi:hypothetical protein
VNVSAPVPVPNIVGLTGYAQHGKNTIAEVFEGLGYRPMAFADALREMARRLNPVIHSTPVAPQGEPYEELRWHYVRYADMVDTLGYESAKQHPEVRRVLQVLGTECVRDIIGDNAWVQALTRQLFPGEKYVITDVRFPNEASAVHGLGGEVWRAVRLNEDGSPFDNGIGTDHPSEAHIASLPVNVVIVARSVDELQGMVKSIIGARGTA